MQVTSANATDTTTHPTWSYAADTHTLTLSGAAIDAQGTVYSGYGIAYEGEDDLNIVLSGTNSISALGTAIWLQKANLSISGEGTLTAISSNGSGIYTAKAITIDGGTVNAKGSADGITGGADVTINNGIVTAEGGNGITTYGTVTINGGTVKATGAGVYSNGINGQSVVIEDGTVTAFADGENSYGIFGENNVKITGGTVKAETTDQDSGYGIYALIEGVTVSGGSVTAAGGFRGICTPVGGDAFIKLTGGSVIASGTDRGVFGKSHERHRRCRLDKYGRYRG